MKISARLLLAAAALATATSASAISNEISAGANLYLPQNGLFSTGVGGEASYRRWFSPDWGVTASAGFTRLDVKDNRTQVAPGTAGSFDLVPLGLDLTCNLLDLDIFRLNANLGLRYAIVNSDASCLNIAGKRVDMTLDDTILGRIGLDADLALAKHVALFAAAGFQEDFEQNKLQTPDGALRKTDLSGFNLEAGLRINF